MAFTGDPIITLVSESLLHITGVSLAAGASGLIVGLTAPPNAGGNVPPILLPRIPCPVSFLPRPYRESDDTNPTTVRAEQSLEVSWHPVGAGAGTFMPVIVITKVSGNGGFSVTMENLSAEDSPAMEIYLRYK